MLVASITLAVLNVLHSRHSHDCLLHPVQRVVSKYSVVKHGVSSLLYVQVHEISTEDEEEGEVIEEHEGTESEGEESGGEVYSSLPAEVLSSLSLSTARRSVAISVSLCGGKHGMAC